MHVPPQVIHHHQYSFPAWQRNHSHWRVTFGPLRPSIQNYLWLLVNVSFVWLQTLAMHLKHWLKLKTSFIWVTPYSISCKFQPMIIRYNVATLLHSNWNVPRWTFPVATWIASGMLQHVVMYKWRQCMSWISSTVLFSLRAEKEAISHQAKQETIVNRQSS